MLFSNRSRQMVAVLVLTISILSQNAAPQNNSRSHPTTSANDAKPNKSTETCTRNGTYVNSKGETVKRPEHCSRAPQGATAQCRDGTYSFSRSRRGTCSHHGGVEKWL